ncbi:MAG: hypothetical protein ACI3YE_00665 [Candidatus Avispirillum sp.]
MKKLAAAFISLVLVISLAGCSIPKDDVLDSLGKYESKQFFTSGGFQDFTDYAKYCFDSVDFSDNSYFQIITESSRENLEAHIDDFENWIQAISDTDADNEVVVNYDFDRSIISDADYVYIYDDPDYAEFGNYNVYYFDVETNILYYFHNNI